MNELEALVRVLTILSILVGLVTIAAPALLFFWSRKYFPEKEDTVSPLHLEERLRSYTEERNAMVEKLGFDIREAFNASVGRVEAGSVQRHADLCKQVEDVKQGIRDAFKAARAAETRATDAERRAQLAETRVNGMEKLLDVRLAHMEGLMNDLKDR